MRPCTASVPTVCRSLFGFHFYHILFTGLLLLAGFSSPACSQDESTSGQSGFASESTSKSEGGLSTDSSPKETNDSRLELVGSLGGFISGLAWEGKYAYVGIGRHLSIIDLTNPAKPEFINRLVYKHRVNAVISSEQLLIVGDEGGGIYVYGLTDPASPILLNGSSPLNLRGGVMSLDLQGGTLYAAVLGRGLSRINLINPASPQLDGEFLIYNRDGSEYEGVTDFSVAGHIAFVQDTWDYRFFVVDLSTHPDPTLITEVDEFSYMEDTAVLGNILYVSNVGIVNGYVTGDKFIKVVDASQPENLKVINTLETDGYDIQIHENLLFVYGTEHPRIQVFDISDPIKPVELEFDPSLIRSWVTDMTFHGSLSLVAGAGAHLYTIDWVDPLQPTILGTYSEPFFVRQVCPQGTTLLAASDIYDERWVNPDPGEIPRAWLIDVSSPEEPRVLSSIVTPFPVEAAGWIGEYAFVLSGEDKTWIFGTLDPHNPVRIGQFPRGFSGDIVYDSPYLYGNSASKELTILNLADPASPLSVYSSHTSASSPYGFFGIEKKNSYLFNAWGIISKEVKIFDVHTPSNPTQVSSHPFSFRLSAMELAGNTLYLTGMDKQTLSHAYLTTMDARGPTHTLRPLRNMAATGLNSAMAVSAGVLYTAGAGWDSDEFQYALDLYDISNPLAQEPPRLYMVAGEGENQYAEPEDIEISGGLIYVAQEGLCIYRHIFPDPPTEVSFHCAGPIFPDTREMGLKIFWGDGQSTPCESPSVITATPLVDCRLGCPFVTEEGPVPCDETSFSSPINCEETMSVWLDDVVAAIEDQAGDLLRVTRTSETSFSLESIRPFYGTLCGEEMGLSCDEQHNRPLLNCPVYNLFDGVDGNENAAASGGFGIVWNRNGVVVENTPTPSPTQTPSPSPTFTETALPTVTETSTSTATPSSTPAGASEESRFERVVSFGGKSRVVAMAGNYAYAGIGPHLTVLDIQNPADPRCVKRIYQTYQITSIAMNGNLLVIGDEMGSIFTFSIENPADPVLLNSSHPLKVGSGANPVKKIFIEGTTAYITSETVTLTVVSLSDPGQPEIVGTYTEYQTDGTTPAPGLDVCLVGDTAYLGVHGSTLHIMDLHEGASPSLHKILPTVAGPTSMAVSGEYVYALNNEILYCLESSVPRSPRFMSINDINANYLALMGDLMFAWSSSLGMYNVSNPHNPVKVTFDPLPHSQNDPLDPIHPYAIYVNKLVVSGTRTLIARTNGDFLLVDWQEATSPQVLGTYSEPVSASVVNLNDSKLYISGFSNWGYIWNVDLSDIGNPRLISEMQSLKGYYPLSLASDETILIAGFGERPIDVYGISDLQNPEYLATIPIWVNGKMAFDWPYLYIASSKRDLTVIDLTDPVNPVMLHDGNVGDPCAVVNAEKKGDYVYSLVNQNLLVFDVGKPVSPSLIYSVSTEINLGKPHSSYLAGQNLFLCGYEYQYPRRPYFYSFDLTDPFQPEPDLSILLFQDPMRFAVSAGAAYLRKTSTLAAMDILPPDVGDVLCTSGDNNANGCVTYGPYVITNDGDYGLSIYRHILPATPTEVTFNCAGVIQQDTRELHFKIFAGDPPEGGCSSASVISATPLVDCRLGCSSFIGEATASCIPAATDCQKTLSAWIDVLAESILDQAGDKLRLERTAETSLSLESIQPFYGALCSDELGVPCDGQQNRVLYDCSIHNLMDGVDGNENSAETGGFGIVWRQSGVAEEATPTPTPTETETPLPTPSITQTATETSWPTDTETPVPTPTATLDADIVPDGKIDAKDLLELIGSMGTKSSGNWTELLFDFSQAWKP